MLGPPYRRLLRSAGATEDLFVTRELHQEPPPRIPTGLGEMVTDLKQLRQRYPLTILYTDLEVIRYAYRFFKCKMEPAQYRREPDPENRIFAQYHAFYPDDMKEFIVKDLAKERPTIHVVFATVSLGIGLDAPSVRKIIHSLPTTSIAEYVQETGRAGRDSRSATAVLYYNKTDIRRNRPGLQLSMRQYCQSTDKCFRELLLAHLGYSPPADRRL